MAILQNSISANGFVAEPNHPSGLRFPTIELAAAKVFASEPECNVTITNPMDKGEAELSVATKDGMYYTTRFAFDGLAIADASEQEGWWEGAIRSAWEKIKPQQTTDSYEN